ncbi:hypothetical protein LEMLEM_LOCUS8490 [Lemmus lemmus]
MTEAGPGRKICSQSPSLTPWRTSGRHTDTSSWPASSLPAVTMLCSRMASSPCGKTTGTSGVAAGCSVLLNNSATRNWTVCGWRHCYVCWGRVSRNSARRYVEPLSTSAPKGTRLLCGQVRQRTKQESCILGTYTKSVWASLRRPSLGTRPMQTLLPRVIL